MIVESYNESAALTALNSSFIDTRITVSVQPETEIFRFVKDTHEKVIPQTGDDWIYHPVPYSEFSPISSGDGQTADTGTITLDGNYFLESDRQLVDDVLQSILQFPLRDRPIQIGLMVLNPETKEVIGLIPQFVGFVDNTPMTREKGEPTIVEFIMASFRAYARRLVARTNSDTDHATRFPGDRSARWISDSVFRRGKYPWNTTSASGSGGGSGGGYNPRERDIIRRGLSFL